MDCRYRGDGVCPGEFAASRALVSPHRNRHAGRRGPRPDRRSAGRGSRRGAGTFTVLPPCRHSLFIAISRPRQCSPRAGRAPGPPGPPPGSAAPRVAWTPTIAKSCLLPTAYCLPPTRVFWAGGIASCSDRRTPACGSAIACGASLARSGIVPALARLVVVMLQQPFRPECRACSWTGSCVPLAAPAPPSWPLRLPTGPPPCCPAAGRLAFGGSALDQAGDRSAGDLSQRFGLFFIIFRRHQAKTPPRICLEGCQAR